MHKLAIFLLSFLVLLMPIGTSMNAMAITENEYYTDQYMRYADDMVNEYEDEPSYENDDGYKPDRSYENDNYDREYSSYKQYSNSYGYNDNYKSKDKDRSDNSVSISKIKCENVNNNFNNVVIGNLSIGNSGSRGVTSDDGTNGASTANANGNNGERYYDGYKKDKGVSCIINNNNNNTFNVAGGNATEPVRLTCEECFRAFLTEDQITFYLSENDISSLDEACERFFTPGSEFFEGTFIADLRDAGASLRNIVSLIECLQGIGVIFIPNP